MKDEQKEASQQPEAEVSSPAQSKEDKHLIVWMSIACGLCVGIIGVLAYWLNILM